MMQQYLLQILLSLVTVALLLVAAFLFHGKRRRRQGEPPVESGWIPYLGLLLEYSRDPLRFLLSRQQKHGNIFTVKIAGKYITFLMDPFQFHNVIRQGRQLDFSEFADEMSSRTFDYPELIEATFPQLRVNLHRIYSTMQGKGLDKLTDSMMGNLQHVFKLKFSQATDWVTEKMYQFCCSIMFEASFMTLYGRDPAADGHKAISEIRDKFTKFDAKFPYFVINIPIALLGDTRKTREELIHILFPNNILNRKEVSEVVQARQNVLEQYDLLKDYDRGAHHFAFMWASIANTIPATFWTMYYLVRHPKALAAVRGEIDHLLQSTGQRKEPGYIIHLTREQLDNLVYLGSAVQESLRLCSASMNIRVVQEDFILKLEGDLAVSLRKGDWVALYPQTLHKDPEIYENPEEFKFDRFVENGKEKTTFYKRGKKLKYYLMPFGSGVSKCPGRFFAVNEIKQFLALAVTYFDLEFIEDKNLITDNSRSGLGILFPNADIHFRWKLRF
ncbi:cytochrome P450 7B1 [Microcaecilia unicolor]|uniref:25/26-hydroxycholesterol 7alpha-hydroxylase n=1 Tax=Microcaecilia unicolor TaxID=1415580 RepID=A0A6P7YUQ0_9AMPH|nr:25-hydroxycholesterol 7-alpha-hydroxylase [Microcaecilia unicolor]